MAAGIGDGMPIVLPGADRIGRCFGSDYAGARRLFLAACERLGVPTSCYRHPLAGPDGAELATEAVRIGPAAAERLLVVVSGTHGPEGLAGSGCQVAWLSSDAPRHLPPGVAVLLVHMINPWGAAWSRRQNEDNLDLNRSFRRWDGELPHNARYDLIHADVACRDPARWAQADARIAAFRAEAGEAAYAAALFAGQFAHPDGVGYGGRGPSWSSQTLLRILQDHGGAPARTAVVDIHTGLGAYGQGLALSLDAPDSPELSLARRLFGPGTVASNFDPAMPYRVTGALTMGVAEALPGLTAGITLEYGTFPAERLYRLQIEDCRRTAARDGGAPADLDGRQELRSFFHPATPDWLHLVGLRFLQLASLAIDVLGGPEP